MAAQTFYVCQGGDGTTPLVADAAHCWDADDVSTAGNWANPKQDGKVGPGDTVYFMSDGGNITGTGANGVIIVGTSGDSGSVITLMGDGSAIIDGEATRRTLYAISKNYLTITNLEFYNGAGSQNMVNLYACDDIEISNCLMHVKGADTGSIRAFLAGTGERILIRYCTFKDSHTTNGHGVYFYQDSGGEKSADVIVEYCLFENLHTSGMKFNGTSERFTGCVIRYNYFENCEYDIEICTTDNLKIHGNIHVHNTIGCWDGIQHDEDNVGDLRPMNTEIYNETFYGYFEGQIYFANYQNVIAPSISALKNCIFYLVGGAGANAYFWYESTDDVDADNVDYNCYYANPVSPAWKRYGVAAEASLADWRTATGFDANSAYDDPLFTNPGSGVFTLQAGSPALGGGTSGGPAQGLHPTVTKGSFGRGGSISLATFQTARDIGAYAYSEPNPWVMIYG